MALNKEQILGALDLVSEEVPVPEWGGSVWVKRLTGSERDAYEASLVTLAGKSSTPNLENARAKLLVRAVCDETGKRLFGDGDVQALGGKSAAVLDRLYEVASRLSGVGKTDLEELEKNSAPAPGSASG